MGLDDVLGLGLGLGCLPVHVYCCTKKGSGVNMTIELLSIQTAQSLFPFLTLLGTAPTVCLQAKSIMKRAAHN